MVHWNGLHLEAQMLDQLGSLGDRQLAVGDHLPEDLLLDWPETDEEGNPLHDPHIWNSPAAWSLVVEQVADKLHLLQSVVNSLEKDCYDRSRGETFVRGYLRNYARLLGIDETHGSIEPGKKADVAIVSGDPLEDIYALRRVRMVGKSGRWFRATRDELPDYWQGFSMLFQG